MSRPTRVLFVCSRNRWRSPTAEEVFAADPRLECLSAGLAPDAETRLTPDLVQWADVVVVMERAQRAKLSARFGAHLGGTRVVCLDIPDRYRFMDPALVDLLHQRAGRFLPSA